MTVYLLLACYPYENYTVSAVYRTKEAAEAERLVREREDCRTGADAVRQWFVEERKVEG